MKKPKLSAVTFVLFFFLNGYGLAFAHAVVVESSPRESAVLEQAPDRIQLRFNVKIEKTLTHVSLTKGGKQRIKLPPSDFSQSAPERLEVLLPPLEPGDYLLRYSVLAADGHTTQGALRFSIAR
ncbi:MAG TPA: copper resistance CopC family protein [Burkholderiales bacterium]|nr:copper resistance CopC family protein [Burkholderiales bacterium]